MSFLWMTIEPRETETRLQLSVGGGGLCLRARLPVCPHHPRALAQLLEALVGWYGRPLTACARCGRPGPSPATPSDGPRLLGDLDADAIRVEWVHPVRPAFRRDRFMGGLGDFRRARHLVTFAATGES